MYKLTLFLTLLCYSATQALSQPLQVTVTNTQTCQDDGTATATVTGGVPPYQYVWTKMGQPAWGPQMTAVITGLSTGYYQLTVTDAAGNVAYGYEYINSPIQFYVNTSPDTCFMGKGTAQAVVVNGTGPYTYQWYNGDTNDSIFNQPAGPISIIVTDANGCFVNSTDFDSTGTSAYNIWNTSSFTISFTSTLANCLNGTATANVSGGIPPYTYNWNTSPPQNTQIATGLSANNTYRVIVTDASSCTGDNFVYIQTNSNLSVNSTVKPDTCAAGNGSITIAAIAGSPPYSYLWSNGNTTTFISGLAFNALYSVIVTDNLGCTQQENYFISSYSPINITVATSPSSCSAPTGSLMATAVGGTGPYTYTWLTTPVQTTATATSLSAGNYDVFVTDANGCTRTSTAILNDNSNLSISSPGSTSEMCSSANGTASIVASNGVVPYTYSWNTSPVQTTATATGLSYGTYKVTVTDAMGCIRNRNVQVGRVSPMQLSAAVNDASCIFSADGMIVANPSGGAAPYNYSWSAGMTTPTIAGLLPGYYHLVVTDVNGCTAYDQYKVGYTSLSPCAVEIAGTVYSDNNTNCIYDWNEPVNNLVKVYCTPDGSFQFTSGYGNFNFIKATPGTYDLDMVPPFWYDWSCGPRPMPVNASVAGNTVYTDLAVAGNALDMIVYSHNLTAAVPGFNFIHEVFYRNQGSLYAYANTLKINYDPLLNFNGSSPAPFSVNAVAGEVYYTVSGPTGTGFNPIFMDFTVPVSMPIGYQLEFKDSIFTVISDTVPLNNYYAVNELVVGSFDPNDIAVSPKGAGLPGYIGTTDSLLRYTVRFQNTGNYPATNVVVKVQANPNLDINTLEFLGSTFPATIEVSPTGLITFSFLGIYLPDSIMNEAESHGALSFSLKQQPALQGGTAISVSADIYFDFNVPVTTNIALNTITAIGDVPGVNNGLFIYPVPAAEMLNVKLENDIQARYVRIMDMMGRVLEMHSIQSGQMEFSLDISKLNDGLYLLSVEGESSTCTSRFIKQ